MRIILWPLGLLYGSVAALRNLVYDQGWLRAHRVGVPVISIGNITVGGTGKTPMAEFLLGKLLEMGLRPGYLSRGYGRRSHGFAWVVPGRGGAEMYGDEALQVASGHAEVPVAVCEDRVAGAGRMLAEREIDVLVLDDAFQHRRIARDLDVVMVDATRAPWRDWPLPSGRLREFRRGLRRSHALVVSKAGNEAEARDALDRLRRQWPDKVACRVEWRVRGLRSSSGNAPVLAPEACAGRAAVVFAGLGNNAHFLQTVRGLGIEVLAFFPFPDHHSYSPADIEKILVAMGRVREIKGKLAPAFVLTSEKDHFRLQGLPLMEDLSRQPLYYVEAGLRFVEGWEELEQKIKEITRHRAYGSIE